MNRKAQSPPLAIPVWPTWPRISDRALAWLIGAFCAALLAIDLVFLGLVVARAWTSYVPVAAQPAPVAQPAALVAVAAPVQPIVAPAPAPAPIQIPIVRLDWKPLAGAPYASALTVKDDTLYIIQNRPGGYLAWHQERDAWVSRSATSAEEALTYNLRWRESYPWITEVLGDPPGITWVKGNEAAFIATRGQVGDDNRDLPRLFLRVGEGWTEIAAPADGKGYGFIAIGDKLFVAIGEKIWQATQQSP